MMEFNFFERINALFTKQDHFYVEVYVDGQSQKIIGRRKIQKIKKLY